jgi:hypothetical protein
MFVSVFIASYGAFINRFCRLMLLDGPLSQPLSIVSKYVQRVSLKVL